MIIILLSQFGVQWYINGSTTIAPSDIIWYDHPSIPEFQNTLLMTVLKGKKLVRFEFNLLVTKSLAKQTFQ